LTGSVKGGKTWVLDVEVELAAPVDGGGFGNFDFLRDKCKAPGFGPETNNPGCVSMSFIAPADYTRILDK
jgi:hypothetical protein